MADLRRRIVAEFSAVNRAKGEMAGFRRDMDTTGRAMRRMAGQAMAMAGLGGGIYAVKRGFDAVTKAAMVQERAERDLMAATQGSIAQYKAYAAQMQSLTVYGDEQILTQMAYARNLGVTKDKLQEAATAAIGLAARFRIDLASAMMLVGRASQGQTQMLTRYGIIIDQNLSAQDKFNELLKIGAQSFRLAEEETKTAEGALAQLKNTYGDILEIIGEPMAAAMAQNAIATKDWLESVRPYMKRYIDDFAQGYEIAKKYQLFMLDLYSRTSLAGLIYRGLKEKPEPIAKPKPKVGPLSELEISDLIMERNRARAAELFKLIQQEAEQREMMQEHRMKMSKEGGTLEEMEWRRDIERTRLQVEAEIKAAKEIDEIDREMWLEQEERAYHAMRAPIIAAEELARESAERRKRIAEDIALAMAHSWTNAIDRMMFEGEKFWDAMKDMARDLIRMIAQIIIYKKFAEPFAYGIMGLPVPGMGEGGGGGGAPAPVFTSPHGGPALQRGGTVERTGWAKVHKGEKFSGVQAVGEKSIDVHIHNESQEKLKISHAESYLVSDQRIIDVFIRRSQTDGPLRRSITQATR